MNESRQARLFQSIYFIPSILILLYITSRLLYFWAGVRFSVDTIRRGWQFIDPLLLKTDLWRSIFYMHGQPPLLNAFTGIVLQVFPVNYIVVFHIFYLLCGVVLLFSLYGLGLRLGFRPWFAALISIWFVVSPATVVYENWYAYAYPLTAILCFATYFLFRFVETGRPLDGILFSIPLAVMSLTWGLFHIFWLVLCLGIGVFAILKKRQIKSALWILLSFILVLSWYGKNAILYDSFTASSWGGMNLSKIVTLYIPGEVRKTWVKEGIISELGSLPPFRSPDTYLEYFPDTPITGVPLLDEIEYSTHFPNYHHLVYVKASKQAMKDALRMIWRAPGRYARALIQSAYIYFHSANDYEHVLGVRQPVDGLDTVWNRLFYGQWHKGETFANLGAAILPDHVAWLLVIGFLFVVLRAPIYLWKNRALIFSRPRHLLILFMAWNILFVSIAGIMLDIGENNRFRFVIDPFLLLLSVFFIVQMFPYLRSRVLKEPGI
ncbi:MAG: ArnT family glycosyltransferase [Anaerolineales bacterium]